MTDRKGRRYALISPCRDEEQYMRGTLRTVAQQTVPPAVWVVVDDGSCDNTGAVLREHVREIPYLKIITRGDRGFRKVGGGVVDAFNEGFAAINPADYDYVCKLDMDLELPEAYFEDLMKLMEADDRLGACSGKPYYIDQKSGNRVSERLGDDHAAGMTKFYRVSCFKEIGGFVANVGWDSIDGHTCRMLGWRSRAINEQRLAFHHLRPMGSSYLNIWHGRARHGIGLYIMGTHPIYLAAIFAYRLNKQPIILGAVGMVWGYIISWMRRRPQYDNEEFRAFLRRYQLRVLLVGKSRAAEEFLAAKNT